MLIYRDYRILMLLGVNTLLAHVWSEKNTCFCIWLYCTTLHHSCYDYLQS